MGYKKMAKGISCAQVALLRSMEHKLSVKMMERTNTIANWESIEALLQEYCPGGQSHEGADDYPPLMLLKLMVLQKWFHIPTDPRLGNHINDGISFFLGRPFNKLSPDHSTFSRFRSRLHKEAVIEINHEPLLQFSPMVMTINERIAIDARLVNSASRSKSNDKLRKLKEKMLATEDRRDRKDRLFL